MVLPPSTINEWIKYNRKFLPREGIRKLTKLLDPDFNKANLKIGRDSLFNIIRKHNMLTLRKNIALEPPTYYTGFISTRTTLTVFRLLDPIKYGLVILRTSKL